MHNKFILIEQETDMQGRKSTKSIKREFQKLMPQKYLKSCS